MPVRHVALTGTLRRASGNPATGWVLIGVVNTTQSPGTDEVIVEQVDAIELVNGAFSAQVPVADDENLAEPVQVELRLLLDDTRPQVWAISIETTEDTVDLADVILLPMPAENSPPVVPWSAVGRIGGVAPLDAFGRVPLEFLPGAVTGEPVDWFEGDGAPPLVIPGASPGDMYHDRVAHRFYQLK